LREQFDANHFGIVLATQATAANFVIRTLPYGQVPGTDKITAKSRAVAEIRGKRLPVTSDMAFECLFVSRDPRLFSTFGRILRDLAISMDVCLSPSRAINLLDKGHTDLVVIDWDSEESSDLLQKIWMGGKWRQPTVVAISSSNTPVPGAHVVLRKPITHASGAECMKTAYSKMLFEYRRHARYALMTPLVAAREDGRTMSVTVVDIGEGGTGLHSEEKLEIGDVVSFRLLLPSTQRDILVRVRVLWTLQSGRAGCEFMPIPPVDLMILHDWLNAKAQVKKPLTPV